MPTGGAVAFSNAGMYQTTAVHQAACVWRGGSVPYALPARGAGGTNCTNISQGAIAPIMQNHGLVIAVKPAKRLPRFETLEFTAKTISRPASGPVHIMMSRLPCPANCRSLAEFTPGRQHEEQDCAATLPKFVGGAISSVLLIIRR